MPNGADAPKRVDRGRRNPSTGEPLFNDNQRIFLLEREFDERETADDQWKAEVKAELKDIRKLVSNRLNWIITLGFSLLVSVVGVLVAVAANK